MSQHGRQPCRTILQLLPFFLRVRHSSAVPTRIFVSGDGGGGDCPHSPDVMLKKLASALAGMPDRPIHDYFGVSYELVWDVVRAKILRLQREAEKMLRKEASSSKLS